MIVICNSLNGLVVLELFRFSGHNNRGLASTVLADHVRYSRKVSEQVCYAPFELIFYKKKKRCMFIEAQDNIVILETSNLQTCQTSDELMEMNVIRYVIIVYSIEDSYFLNCSNGESSVDTVFSWSEKKQTWLCSPGYVFSSVWTHDSQLQISPNQILCINYTLFPDY